MAGPSLDPGLCLSSHRLSPLDHIRFLLMRFLNMLNMLQPTYLALMMLSGPRIVFKCFHEKDVAFEAVRLVKHKERNFNVWYVCV